MGDNAAAVAARKPRLPRRINANVLRLARAQQYLYNKAKRAEEANAIMGLQNPALQLIDGMGAYRRRRKYRRYPTRYSKRRYYRGRGGYGEDIGKMIGQYAGGFHGASDFGGRAGGFIGDQIENFGRKVYNRIRGRGDYTNNLINDESGADGRMTDTIPVFSGSGDEQGTVNIARKEYIMDIKSTGLTTFVNQNWQLNPGNAAVFPFLSQIAQHYEEYEFQGLVFHYRTVVPQISSSTSSVVGTVIMAENSNPANPNFTNKQQMMEYAGAASVPLNECLTFGIECDPSKRSTNRSMFVTTLQSAQAVAQSNTTIEQDPSQYFWSNFQLALTGIAGATFPAGTQIGELWVSYNVKLRKPKLSTNNDPYANAIVTYGSITTPVLSSNEGSGLNSQVTLVSGSQLPGFVFSNSSPLTALYRFDRNLLLPGKYNVFCEFRLSPTIVAGGVGTTGLTFTPTNCTALTVLQSLNDRAITGSVFVTFLIRAVIQVTQDNIDAGASFIIGTNNVPITAVGAGTIIVLSISQCNNNLLI